MRSRTPRRSGRLNPSHALGGPANRLPVSAETRRRWRRRGTPPPLAVLALRLLEGELGEISEAWSGWRVRQGELVSPEGETWTPGRLTAWVLQLQLLEEYRRRLARPQQWALF